MTGTWTATHNRAAMQPPPSHLPKPFGFIDELAGQLQQGPVACTRDAGLHAHWALASWNQTPGLATTKRYPFNTVILHFGGSNRVERRRNGRTTHVEALIGGVTTIPEGEDIDFEIQEPIEVLQLYFDQSYVADVVGEECAERVGPVPEVFCAPDAPVQSLMQALRSQLHSDTWRSAVGALALEHTVRATVAQLTHGLARTAAPEPSRVAARRMLQVRDYVEAHLGDPISVRELSAVVGLSVEHFCRSFKAQTGLSPLTWIRRQRIGRAQELLKNRTVSVADVAFRTGFSSPSHLSRSFRAAVGTTPGEFRRQHQR